MKKLLLICSLCVLSAKAFCGDDRLNTTSGFAAARVPLTEEQKKLEEKLAIAPNTPAFEEYAFNMMLSEANRIRKGRRDIPTLSANSVFFGVRATPDGILGGIFTRDRRFIWSFNHNCMFNFVDTNYWPQSFRYDDDASEKLAKIKSRITEKEAEKIAREFLHDIGNTEQQLGLIEPPEVNQYKFQETNDVIYPLPCFNISWKTKASDPTTTPVEIVVSGIINQVVVYVNSARENLSKPIPTNYMEMLEVSAPTNNAQKIGLKPWPKIK